MTTRFREQLQAMNACKDALSWVGDKDLPAAWTTCNRADWMFWLAHKVGIDRKIIVLAACDCAETAMFYVPAGEKRPQQAIDTARAWCRNEATLDDVRKAEYAAYAASAASAASYAAAGAAGAAAYAAYAASAASYAATSAALYATASTAYAAAHTKMTLIVRRHITYEQIAAAMAQSHP